MSYQAKVFNVLIASPGDVASERAIIRDVIYEWNAVHSVTRNIVLLPIGWEYHSSPEMGASPQAIINKQILEKCDLLAGVFWTRIGTPTKEHPSGTVEEIEKHMKSGKPAMLYFSGQPVVMESVDLKQYQELQSFKKSCQSRGLYESYDSHSDFKDKFYRQLQLKVNQHEIFASTREGEQELEPVQSKTKLPSLSGEARIILKEASLDPHGHVLYLRVIGGTHIQVNGKDLTSSNERREIARWEAAIQELANQELLIEIGHKGEIFELTNVGYQVADMIEL